MSEQPIHVNVVNGGTMETANIAGIVHGGMGNTILNTGDGSKTTLNLTHVSQCFKESRADIMERTISHFQSWNKNIVRTAALGQVLDKLKAGTTWLTIKGNPGEGKTTVGFMALEELHRCGRQVFEVRTPEEFTEVVSTCPRPVIMLDDVFGSLKFDQRKWLNWEPVVCPLLKEREHKSHEEEDQTSKKDVTVILIGRDYVLNSPFVGLGRLSYFLTSSKHCVCLDNSVERGIEERRAIWESISRTSGVELDNKKMNQILMIKGPHGFPHVCRLFTTIYKHNNTINVCQFFMKPLEFLNESISNLFNDTNKVMLFKEMMKYEGEISERELRQFDPTYKTLQIAKELVGSYLKYVHDCVVFDHPSIYDSVAFQICSQDPEFVIKHCQLSFIDERVRLHMPEDSYNAASRLVVTVKNSYADDLAERFANEIMAQHFVYVLSHQAFTDRLFVNNVMSKIKTPLKSLLHSDDKTISPFMPMKHPTFFELVLSSKSPELLKYIDNCPDIELSESYQDELMFRTCSYGASKVLLYLKETRNSFNINRKIFCPHIFNTSEMTPLMIAAESGDVELIQLILSLKPDLEARDTYGRTALHYLCQRGQLSVVSQVIQNVADVSAADNQGRSVLSYACEHDNFDVVRLLIRVGAIVDAISFSQACTHGSLRIVELICANMHQVSKVVVETSLSKAVQRDIIDIDIMELLLAKGASVNSSGTSLPPLHAACKYHHPQAVKWLLQQGADINTRGQYNSTALHHSVSTFFGYLPENTDPRMHIYGNTARGRSKECTDILLKAGAVVNVNTLQGNTPLHCAALSGSIDHVDMLLHADATVNAQNEQGNTPLHEAAQSGFKDIADVLLKAGSELNLQNKDGNTPLCYALMDVSNDCVDVLLSPAVNLQNKDGDTPLHHAAMRGYTEHVGKLLNAGAVVNVQNKDGNTPLHFAAGKRLKGRVDVKTRFTLNFGNKYDTTTLPYSAERGYNESVNVLLKARATVIIQNKDGNTPLHLAAERGSKDCVDVLLKAGAEVNVKNKQDNTPLHFAAERGSKDCVDVLLKAGAEVNVKNKQDNTPLHFAALGRFKDCVDVLLKAGAEVNVKNEQDYTPLSYAAMGGFKDCVDVLLKAGAEVNVKNIQDDTPLHFAAMGGFKDCVDVLLKAGAEVNVKNEQDDTLLSYAAMGKSKGCVDVLLKAGAIADLKNKDGNTPLHCAARYGPKECVDMLLKAGVAVNAKNKDGDTSLHLLCLTYNNSCKFGLGSFLEVLFSEKARLLIANGADKEILNNHGIPALNGELIKHLEEDGTTKAKKARFS